MKKPHSSTRPTLFTIGYEQATQQAVLDELKASYVKIVVDVRAVTASRRPGFSKRQLEASLADCGIDYLHLRGLGTPAEGRQAARSGRFKDLFRIYEGHLATRQAREDLDELTTMARQGRRVCLLCYERSHEHCHRRRIAELVCDRVGVEVKHLAAPLFR
jgi:uncharacterized protein (DUF488 family)